VAGRLLWAGALALALALAPAGRAAAQSVGAGDDSLPSIDDPKVARRLGTRDAVPGTPGPVAVADPSAPVETVTRAAPPPPPPEHLEPTGPRLQLGFRRFSFVQVGASAPGSLTGAAASEPFDSLSLDFYPISTYVRFGLSSQYGWQSGNFAGSGDYFLAQSFSLGAQLPIVSGGQAPWRQLTPFAEAYAGGGYMRRLQFGVSVPTVYWQLGVDAGMDVFFARHGFVSFALGYIHPVNGYASEKMTSGIVTSASFTTVFVDTWSFKVGIGL
jgi:hypothetical protein